MNSRTFLLVPIVAVALLSGCASYRVSSNVSDNEAPLLPATQKVIISEDALPGRSYKDIGTVNVSVKKLTIFHKDPTKEQANEALAEKARAIGADAVINVTYKSGVGFTTWGYMDAKGRGVKLENGQGSVAE